MKVKTDTGTVEINVSIHFRGWRPFGLTVPQCGMAEKTLLPYVGNEKKERVKK
mgnify:CR=1 FL=1